MNTNKCDALLVHKLSGVLLYSAFLADKEQGFTSVYYFYPFLHSFFGHFCSDFHAYILHSLSVLFLFERPLSLLNRSQLSSTFHLLPMGQKTVGFFFVLSMQMLNFHSPLFFLTSLQ